MCGKAYEWLTAVFPKVFFFLIADPFWFRKITADPHIISHVNVECPDDRYTKLKICISVLILESYECMPVAYVEMRCMS